MIYLVYNTSRTYLYNIIYCTKTQTEKVLFKKSITITTTHYNMYYNIVRYLPYGIPTRSPPKLDNPCPHCPFSVCSEQCDPHAAHNHNCASIYIPYNIHARTYEYVTCAWFLFSRALHRQGTAAPQYVWFWHVVFHRIVRRTGLCVDKNPLSHLCIIEQERPSSWTMDEERVILLFFYY